MSTYRPPLSISLNGFGHGGLTQICSQRSQRTVRHEQYGPDLSKASRAEELSLDFGRLLGRRALKYIASPYLALSLALLTHALTAGHAVAEPTASEAVADPRAHLGERELRATQREGEVIIDGRLSEPAWERAEESVGFVERKPNPGAKPPVESAVRVLYDSEALYVGVRLNYQSDQPPVAWELRRDNGSIWSDDALTLKIDPRGDKRTTLGFAMNVAGAYLDLIALDNGRSFLTAYDMVWEGATSIDKRAWYAEFRIPYAALAFEPNDPNPEPGIALSRDHPARQATDDWTLLPPEFGPASAIHYGTLKGLRGVSGGRPLTFIPYLSLSGLDAARPVGGLGNDEIGGARVGGEIRANLGEGTWAEVSALTDFAQVDLDNALLNLTRFPLLYPERRPFFLNGTDVFAFGTSAAQPFFSRRVGLTADGEEVPIYGGVKLYSRSGKLRYGVLSTLSGRSPANATQLEEGLESVSIGRARLEVLDGYVGVIATHLQRALTDDTLWETGYGVDASQRVLNKRLELSGNYSGFINSDQGGESDALPPQSARGEVSWRGADYQSSLSYLYVDERYQPQLGFVRRRDVSLFTASLDRVFYKPLGLNRITIGTFTTASWDAQFEDALDRDIMISSSVTTQTGWSADGAIGYSDRAVVQEEFSLAEVKIPQGHYLGPGGYIGIASPTAGSRVSAMTVYAYDGAFFGGVNHTFSTNVRLSLTRHLRLSADYTYSRFTLPQSSTESSMMGDASGLEGEVTNDEQAMNGGFVITPNINTQIDIVAQLNTQADQWLGLTRLRWRWAPGSDLFLVYRLKSVYERGEAPASAGGWSLDRQQLMFKLAWRFDTLY